MGQHKEMRVLIILTFLTLGLCNNADPRTAEDAEKLLKWAARHRIPASHLKLVKADNGGFDVIAARDIPPHEPFMSVPTSLMIVPRTAVETFPALLTHADNHFSGGRFEDDFLSAVSLLVERHRGKESLWHEYIAMLPQYPLDIHRSALLPREDVARALDNTQMLTWIEPKLKRMGTFVERLMEIEPLCRNLTYSPGFVYSIEDALWAVSMRQSRGFGGIGEADATMNPRGNGLIPLADLFNHMPPDQAPVLRFLGENRVGFQAIVPLVAGSIVHVSYGNHVMEEMMFAYGFALETNKLLAQQLVKLYQQRQGEVDAGSWAMAEELFEAGLCGSIVVRTSASRDLLEDYSLPCGRILYLSKEEVSSKANPILP